MARNFIWPNVDTADGARWATKQATGVAIFCAGLTAVAAILAMCHVQFVVNVLKISGWSMVDAVIFGVIAFYLARQSRVAAWAGLILYLVERITVFVSAPVSLRNPIVPILFTLVFIGGVRGANALHRMQGTPTPESERKIA